MKELITLVARLVVVVAIVGCGGAGGTVSPTGTPAGSPTASVAVTLGEFSVTPSPAGAAAGPVTFQVTNSGALEHEFVVLGPTELAPDQLPSADGGLTVDEAAVGVAAELEGIPAGSGATLDTPLSSGSYVLICNIETHWQSGMRAAFTVP